MKTNRNAFTLIELLVVIAIIGILAAITFPAINKALLQAKISRARQEAVSIASAIELYHNDYGQLPVPLAEQGLPNDSESTYFTPAVAKSILQVLVAEPAGNNANHEMNPRRKVYLSMDSIKTDGTLLDPWGTQYQILLDRNLDMKLLYPFHISGLPQHRRRAIVVSAGPDRQWTGGTAPTNKNVRDNIANVEVKITP